MIKMKCGDYFSYKGTRYYEAKDVFEQGVVFAALVSVDGNKSEAARVIGMSRLKLCRVFNTLPRFHQEYLERLKKNAV